MTNFDLDFLNELPKSSLPSCILTVSSSDIA